MIDTKKPVYFYDNRGRYETTPTMTQILFEDGSLCLCIFWNIGKEIVLFDKNSGEVLTTNYMSWIATNEKQSTGDWIFERSSGYAGYRCRKCGTWVYENTRKKCNCL
jgi:hypothetical protein